MGSRISGPNEIAVDAQDEVEAYIAGVNVALQFEREELRLGQTLETPQELVPDILRFHHPQSGQVVEVLFDHLPLKTAST